MVGTSITGNNYTISTLLVVRLLLAMAVVEVPLTVLTFVVLVV